MCQGIPERMEGRQQQRMQLVLSQLKLCKFDLTHLASEDHVNSGVLGGSGSGVTISPSCSHHI
jgi:hypothetical protein